MKITKSASILLTLLLIAGNTSSCISAKKNFDNVITKNPDKVITDDEITLNTKSLTNVFTESVVRFESGLTPENRVKIYETDGTVTFFCTDMSESVDMESGYYLYTVGTDGREPVKTKINIDDSLYISAGVVTAERLCLLYTEFDAETFENSTSVMCYNLRDGSIVKAQKIERFIPNMEDISPGLISVEVDMEGFVYLSAGNSMCILDPDLTKVFDYVSPDYIRGMISDNDGNVYLSTTSGLCSIERKPFAVGNVVKLSDSIEYNNLYLGDGFDFYYSTDDGLYGYNKGMDCGEMVMNWQNSNLNPTKINELKILAPDMIYVSYNDENGFVLSNISSIFTKSDDIDLSKITEISTAYINDSLSPIPAQVINFNKKNPDIRVTLTDYSTYNNRENNWNGACDKLVNDILNGLRSYDLICLKSDSPVVSEILENGLYFDLYELIAADPEISKDDIVGAVRNTYEIDGKLSAAVPSFNLSTLLAPKSYVEDTASWTLANMLEIENELADDVILVADKNSLFDGNTIFSAFIDLDNYTCDFANQTFVSLVEYLSEPEKEVMRGYSRYEEYQTGKTVLFEKEYRFIDGYQSDEVVYKSKDYVRVGYPSEKGGTHIISGSYIYIIPQNAENPETAWKFLRNLILNKPKYEMLSSSGIRMLRSQNQSYKDDLKNIYSFYPFSGGPMSWIGYREEYKLDENGMFRGRPGVMVQYDESEYDEFMEFIDSAGVLALKKIPDEISNIILEEISVYQSGVRAAESTAGIIQSRVSTWLAERK